MFALRDDVSLWLFDGLDENQESLLGGGFDELKEALLFTVTAMVGAGDDADAGVDASGCKTCGCIHLWGGNGGGRTPLSP